MSGWVVSGGGLFEGKTTDSERKTCNRIERQGQRETGSQEIDVKHKRKK